MELYKIVKNENIGKIYETQEGMKFEIVDYNGQAAVANVEEKGNAVLALTSDAIFAEVTEVIEEVNPYEKPEKGQTYFYISAYNTINSNTWSNSIKDNKLYDTVNCFLTKEEAERVATGMLHGRKITRERTINEFNRKENQVQNTHKESEKEERPQITTDPGFTTRKCSNKDDAINDFNIAKLILSII